MTNKYAGTCRKCGARVEANAGTLVKNGRGWSVEHLACKSESSVVEFRTSGWTFTRNSRGRCEDAPCCGCCTV